MGDIPQGTTHRLFGRPNSPVQYYKLEDGKWYYWSKLQNKWMKNINTNEWLENNLMEVNL